MIAKVRIAPLEQWCEQGKELNAQLERPLKPGEELTIFADSMTIGHWIGDALHQESRFWRGGPGESGMICEHMLEMD